jgi:hypothetical protein
VRGLGGLFVEPGVFEAPAVVIAVDHHLVPMRTEFMVSKLDDAIETGPVVCLYEKGNFMIGINKTLTVPYQLGRAQTPGRMRLARSR